MANALLQTLRERFAQVQPSWTKFPHRYALWRYGITYPESRGYNTTDRILLTFDDEGTAQNIRGILKVLRDENIKAFFFINGRWQGEGHDLIEEIRSEGHWLGSHSYSHSNLTQLSDEQIRSEMRRGLQTPIMRPPYGAYDKRVRNIMHDMGFRIAYWTVDSYDWKGIDATQITQNVLGPIHKGACVLLHLNTEHTLEALPAIIAGIRERGYEFCSEGTEIKEA